MVKEGNKDTDTGIGTILVGVACRFQTLKTTVGQCWENDATIPFKGLHPRGRLRIGGSWLSL